jgi:very-short-patch-repair endonuclease
MDSRDTTIEEIAARQRSLFTRIQAADAGFTPESIEHRLESGRWLLHRHLVYGLLGARMDERTRLLADVLAAEPGGHASHRSAGALLGIPGFSLTPHHVLVPDHFDRVRTTAVLHRTKFLPPHHRRLIDDVPCTSLARTLFDLCGTERLGRSARAVDNALARKWVTVPALWAVLIETKVQGRPGSTVLRALLTERGPSYVPPATELERRFVTLTERFMLPRPRRQVDLGDADQWIGRVDFVFPTGLIAEVDGTEHHTSLLDRTADADRDHAFERTGRSVFRFSWFDVTRRPAAVAATIRHALSTDAAA